MGFNISFPYYLGMWTFKKNSKKSMESHILLILGLIFRVLHVYTLYAYRPSCQLWSCLLYPRTATVPISVGYPVQWVSVFFNLGVGAPVPLSESEETSAPNQGLGHPLLGAKWEQHPRCRRCGWYCFNWTNQADGALVLRDGQSGLNVRTSTH